MAIDLHPDAGKRFNELAGDLRKEVRHIAPEAVSFRKESFQPAIVPAHVFTEKDVGPIPYIEWTNLFTQATERIVYSNGSTVFELATQGCHLLEVLVEKLALSSVGKKVSRRTLRHQILLWISPYEKDLRTFSERILAEISPRVRRYQVWVPIANLRVQSPLQLGLVVFQSVTPELMDSWQLLWSSAKPIEGIQEYFKERRVRYQGRAAATIEIEAEESRAIEIACEEADTATALLRTFCAENLHPLACSHCVPIGRVNTASDEAFALGPNREVVPARQKIPPYAVLWEISDSNRLELDKIGLTKLAQLLSVQRRAEFQEKIISTLLIYNRANMARDPVGKLVFVLVSLETMLLRDSSEPIQENIGIRLAFVVGKDVAERQRVASLVKKCYGLRSQYIHHGQTLNDLSAIEEFLKYVWVFFLRLIAMHEKFESKAMLLDYLEKRKFE